MIEPKLPEAPYNGLMPYLEEDAPFFFGREREREVIIANLMASRLTLLYGASGVGKSSVLRAGVAHHLHNQAYQNLAEQGTPEFIVVVFSSWRDDPTAGLAYQIQDSVGRVLNEDMRKLVRPSRSLIQTLQSWTDRLDSDLLIILDQFEEYFLYHSQEDSEGTFAVEFPQAVNQRDLRVNFLVSIREDSLAKLDRFKGQIPNLFDNYLRIEHLNLEAARAAIEKPIEQYNRLLSENSQPVSIEPELVDAVLNQVKTGQVVLGEVGRGSVGLHPVATATEMRIETPYLQLVMTRLWEQEIGRGSRTLRLETLNRLGGAEHIVRTHLDGVMDALSQSEGRTAANIFQYLVTTSGSKIAYPVLDLAGTAALQESELISLMEKLSSGDMRILRPVGPVPGRPAEPRYERYEIFHDVLGPAILEWRARFEERERESARQEELALERKRVRRLRYGIIGLAFLFVIMAGLVAFTVQQTKEAELHRQMAEAQKQEADKQRQVAEEQRREAETQRQRAEAQGRIALSRQLAAQAISLSSRGLLDLALLLSREALGASETVEARGALLTALQYNPRLTTFLRGHGGLGIWSMEFSPDGKMLASGGGDGRVILWDTQSWRQTGEPLKIPGDVGVQAVAFSPDGKMLASEGSSGTVILWDLQTRQQIGEPLKAHDAGVSSVAFSPDGRILAAGGSSGTVILWDTQSWQQIGQPLGEHDAWVTSIAFSPDGRTLASVGYGGTVILWDPQSRRQMGEPLEIPGALSVAFSPDGRILALGSEDNTVILWDTQSRQQMAEPLRGHSAAVWSVAFSPDGKVLASMSEDGLVILWDPQSRRRMGESFKAHDAGVSSMAVSPDSGTLALGDWDGSVILWNLQTRQQMGEPLEVPGVMSVAFSPDERILALGSEDNTVILWDTQSRQWIGEPLRGHDNVDILGNDNRIVDSVGGVSSVAFSPDGRILVSVGVDARAILWNPQTSQQIGEPLKAHDAGVSSVAFSPDGRILALGDWSGPVILWDIQRGQRIGELLGGSYGLVESMVFSPDGKMLASGGGDGTVILWDTQTRQQIGEPLRGHSTAVWSVAFSPDGRVLASMNDDGLVIQWDVHIDSWKKRACRTANRNLTRSEWVQYFGNEPYHKTCSNVAEGR